MTENDATPVDEAVLDYTAAADDLEALARTARIDASRSVSGSSRYRGFMEWATELEGFAYIARRAADAEADNPDSPEAPCGLCHGERACDIEWHRLRRVVS